MSDRAVAAGVTYLIDKMHLGGAQTHLAALCEALDPARYRPRVVCLDRRGETADRLARLGIPVDSLGIASIYGRGAARALLRLVRLLRRERPAVLHTYLGAANVFGAVAAKLGGIPFLVTSRRDTGYGDGRLMRQSLRLSSRAADRVVAVSDDVARIVAARDGIAAPKLVVIPNAVDLVRFAPRGRRAAAREALGVAADALVVVSVGHLSRVKGTDVLIEAAAQVIREAPGAVFLKAGSGPEEAALRQRLGELQLEGAFRLLPLLPDVRDLLEATDVFCLPSRSEGQPNAAMEAMAMGVPVVASRVGGVPEVMADGKEALLVAPEEPAALARALLKLLGDGDLRRRLGQAAAERARKDFDLEVMAGRYQALYDQRLEAT